MNAISKSVRVVGKERSGNSLEVQKPKECAMALEMLAFGERYSAIANSTGLSPSNISKLKVRHQGALDERRMSAAQELDEVGDTYREIMRCKADQLLTDSDALKKLNPKDVALTVAILTDKPMQLRGEATSVVEHKKGVSLDDVLAMKAELAKKVIDV